MKKLLYTLGPTSSLLTAAMACTAADTPTEKPASTKPKAGGLPFRGKVSAIDKASRTLSLAGREKNRTFQITDSTKIKKEGKPATLDAVTVGESVGGYALRAESGHPEVVTLNIGKVAKNGTSGTSN